MKASTQCSQKGATPPHILLYKGLKIIRKTMKSLFGNLVKCLGRKHYPKQYQFTF